MPRVARIIHPNTRERDNESLFFWNYPKFIIIFLVFVFIPAGTAMVINYNLYAFFDFLFNTYSLVVYAIAFCIAFVPFEKRRVLKQLRNGYVFEFPDEPVVEEIYKKLNLYALEKELNMKFRTNNNFVDDKIEALIDDNRNKYFQINKHIQLVPFEEQDCKFFIDNEKDFKYKGVQISELLNHVHNGINIYKVIIEYESAYLYSDTYNSNIFIGYFDTNNKDLMEKVKNQRESKDLHLKFTDGLELLDEFKTPQDQWYNGLEFSPKLLDLGANFLSQNVKIHFAISEDRIFPFRAELPLFEGKPILVDEKEIMNELLFTTNLNATEDSLLYYKYHIKPLIESLEKETNNEHKEILHIHNSISSIKNNPDSQIDTDDLVLKFKDAIQTKNISSEEEAFFFKNREKLIPPVVTTWNQIAFVFLFPFMIVMFIGAGGVLVRDFSGMPIFDILSFILILYITVYLPCRYFYRFFKARHKKKYSKKLFSNLRKHHIQKKVIIPFYDALLEYDDGYKIFIEYENKEALSKSSISNQVTNEVPILNIYKRRETNTSHYGIQILADKFERETFDFIEVHFLMYNKELVPFKVTVPNTDLVFYTDPNFITKNKASKTYVEQLMYKNGKKDYK